MYDGITICGNFADVLPERPKDFDYMSNAKWLEDYFLDSRECIGGTICNCKKLEVHFAPYYGYDFYHSKGCNLLVKVQKRPQLQVLWAYDHLPAIVFSKKAVPADTKAPLYIHETSKTHHIKVNIHTQMNQLTLI